MNTIEDIIRKVIREELKEIFKDLQTKPNATESTDVTKDEPEESEDAVSLFEDTIENNSELLASIREFCEGKDGMAKRAKELVQSLGYDKFSLVPDEEANDVYVKIIEELS
jgi:hypothetical protein